MKVRGQVGNRRGATLSSPRVSMLLRTAAYEPSTVHLRLTDDGALPSRSDIVGLVESLRDEPEVERVRTSALFPRSADRFAEAGFVVADSLSLLRAELPGRSRSASAGMVASGVRAESLGPVATLRRRNYAAAALVDRAAFGSSWGHDAAELDEIRHATPRHRARYRFDAGRSFARVLRAFAVAGASSEHGYLQRLSVDPDHQRRGHGRALTIDAVRWMTRLGVPDCLVNTSVDNVAALSLYDSLGFLPLRDRLSVMQLDVHAGA